VVSIDHVSEMKQIIEPESDKRYARRKSLYLTDMNQSGQA